MSHSVIGRSIEIYSESTDSRRRFKINTGYDDVIIKSSSTYVKVLIRMKSMVYFFGLVKDRIGRIGCWILSILDL
jgi:hypothetical protein